MDFKIFILALMILGHAYRMILNIVSFKSANNPTPESVKDVYDADTYIRWKKYSAEKNRLGIFSTIVSLFVTLILLVFNCHAAVSGIFGKSLFGQMASVLTFQILVDWVINIFLNYYETMVVEQKYGFNRSTMKTFVIDQIRSLFIEALITFALMSALMLLHRAMGNWVILLFTGVMFVFTLLISFLYPVLSRIGNKFEPLEEGDLRDKLMALLTKNGYQVKDIKVMDASRRTTKLNAYFTGFGKLKTIVLFDNLVNAMSADEICAVFAHELGHGLHKDVLKQQTMNLGNLLLMAVAAWVAIIVTGMHTAFGFAAINYGFAYILMGFMLSLIQSLTGMGMSAYSRFAEYRADRQAVKEGHGEALKTALKKLAKENFAHLAPSKVLVVLEYSHPPLAERIEAIEKALEEQK